MVELKKIKEFVWQIEGTKVPAYVFASDKILEAMKNDKTLEQAKNMTTLPGALKILALPDSHQGYGFCIGGVAALDFEKGGVSPGGIGYDVNCTHPDVKVSLKWGAWKRIKDIEQSWDKEEFSLFEYKKKEKKEVPIVCYMKREEKKEIFELKTLTGRSIKITGNHPILTINGMIKAKDIKENDMVVVNGFEGVEWEEPKKEKIIGAEDIEKMLDNLNIGAEGNARNQILNFLRKNDILEISYNSPKLPILLKLMGFVLGDGVLSYVGGRSGQVTFYGKKEDLESIQSDVSNLGFGCQNIYSRVRNHKINTHYGTKKFVFEEHSINCGSASFAILLSALGVPHGKKVTKEYRVPKWVMNAPLWQKRLFLSAFFGAELSSPATLNKYNFYEPTLNMNKLESIKESSIDFLNDIRLLLADFKVTSSMPVAVPGNQYHGKNGKTVCHRIKIYGNSSNLINFFENISYDYNKQKNLEASLASSYLRLKSVIQKERMSIRAKTRELYGLGVPIKDIVASLSSVYTPEQFIKHSLWTEQRTEPRTAINFISYEDYKKTFSFGRDGFVFDPILNINVIPYQGLVYDVTVSHNDHNFIANNIVVSNCGVRLLTTPLARDDVKDKINQLVEACYQAVPAGLGEGNVKISREELDKVLEKGALWAFEKGYGLKDDLANSEESGTFKGADASKVSDKAKNRGKNQLGSLGSGNHFLEIQYVSDIIDEEKAKVFGLKKNQVVFMIHCGSRGLGHQVCSDYLRKMEQEFPKELAKLPDRELAYAPAGTQACDDYLKAMKAAANFAWCNRYIIADLVRSCFVKVFDLKKTDIKTVYDVAHNIAKIEEYSFDGKKKKVYMHRKGATRAFGPGNKEIPEKYRKTGQPVIIPGSMGTASYVLVGTEIGMKESLGSTAHGAGRIMSRHQAVREFGGPALISSLAKQGIIVKGHSMVGLAEEAPGAYKDIDEVVRVSDKLGIAKAVVKLKPLAVVKG
ncbi:TPA: RNA-splicing ligase RtcB [Candidatus Woesearchaeota archaeon]|nr:RtcB family protein [Candidatus Woesearchaeota archaeon]HIH39568.1 RNA-splicing ligase RtcB [Candidatus Woesearchaeota archaeon]